MIETLQKNNNCRLNWKKHRGENHLHRLFSEFLKSEKLFTDQAKILFSMMRVLSIDAPEEKMIACYHHLLESALPIFERIRACSELISRYSPLNQIEKIHHLAIAYESLSYYESLSDLIGLYELFEAWGGEIEYERLMKKANLFSNEMIEETSLSCSPLLFIQWQYQISFFVNEFLKEIEDDTFKKKWMVIKHHLEAINQNGRKTQMIRDVTDLLAQSKRNEESENLKQAIR